MLVLSWLATMPRVLYAVSLELTLMPAVSSPSQAAHHVVTMEEYLHTNYMLHGLVDWNLKNPVVVTGLEIFYY